MTLRTAVFVIFLLASLTAFTFSCARLIRYLKIGRKEVRSDRIAARLRNVFVIAFGQSKLLREPLAGAMHFFIFWGFVILLSAVLEAVVQGLVPTFTLKVLGFLYPAVALLQEILSILVLLSCLAGLVRWYLLPPKRYFGPEIGGHVRLDATFILGLILLIMVSMIGANAAHMVIRSEPDPARFFSIQFTRLIPPGTAAEVLYEVFWWIHILVVLGFLNYLPYSKHLHVLTSIPNVFFSSLEPRGALPRLDLEDENAEKFGAEDVRDLTWKQLLDGYTCTDCGRCTAVCPAHLTGKPLSPRKIMMNIRERTMELAPVVVGGLDPGSGEVVSHRLLDNFISEEELWACTTCRACMEECPVMIEHVPGIVDMRRYLVLSESRFPTELTAVFRNLETNYSPWAFSWQTRADWAADMDVRIMAENSDDIEVLFWVGCAGSFDNRYQKVTRSLARLMQAANVRFAILGNEEKCTGDPARRCGNEYLAQMLMQENVETLNRYKVKKIVTACPHCFNTLQNEYPQFGGSFEVMHHTEFLRRLLESGRLKISGGAAEKVTFHDSCYLGRYNGVYEAPRELLTRSGAVLAEMPRSRDKGFCCGAGGARMFMEETAGKRVNIERTEEALSVAPATIATACPFCMTMMTDGLKATETDERVQVRDVAEILAAAVPTE